MIPFPKPSGGFCLAAALALICCQAIDAQQPLLAPGAFDNDPTEIETPAFDGEEPIQGLLTPETNEIPWDAVVSQLVVLLFPEVIEGDDNWGETSAIMSGWRVRDGLLVPRYRDVNNGFWQRYSFELLNPHETLQIWIDETSTPQPGVFDCRWRVRLRGRCTVQVAHWVYGVKGFNTSVESDVTVIARVCCRLTLRPHLNDSFLPAVDLQLDLRDLSFRLRDIDTRRIGVIGGWMAREVGDGQRRFIEAILQTQEDRIRRRIQEEIDEEL